MSLKFNPKYTQSEIPDTKTQDSFGNQLANYNFEPKPNKLYLRPFSKFNRKLLFILLFFLNIVINMDHGIIPAGISTLQTDLDLDAVHIGMIGSFVFLGLTIGNR